MTRLKYKNDFILFVEAGFIAVNQADEEAALFLFKAAELANPKNTLPKVGYGYLHLHKLEIKKAVSMFEEVLKKEPRNEMAQTLKGIAYSFSVSETTKGEKILAKMEKSHDKSIKKLSSTALDFVDKFVKKEPTPVQKPLKK